MESILEPGKMIKVGSEEWKVYVINERLKTKENIKKLQDEIQSLMWYLNNIENLNK